MTKQQTVAIVGGGVAGLGAALGLMDHGFAGRVVLVESETELGQRGSRRAAGALRRAGRADAEAELAERAFAHWRALEKRFSVDVGIRQGGVLLVGSSTEHVTDLREKHARAGRGGGATRLLERKEIRGLMPWIRHDVELGLLSPEDGQVDPALATQEVAKLVRSHDRVEIRSGTAVTGIEQRAGRWRLALAGGERIESDWLILAAGAAAPRILETAGLTLPVMSAKVVTLRSAPVEPRFAQFFQDWDAQLFLRQNVRGELQFGCLGQDLIRVDDGVSDREAALVLEAFRHSLPGLGEPRVVDSWAGVIDESRDRLPIIGSIDGADRLLVAAGWSGHGFLLGPYVGDLIARQVMTGEPDPILMPFAPARFSYSPSTSNVDA